MSQKTEMMPDIWEEMWMMIQVEPFQRSVQKFQEHHNMETEADQEQESDIETVSLIPLNLISIISK